jgi:hypothetical protein
MNPPKGIGVAPYCEVFGEPRQERGSGAGGGADLPPRAGLEPGLAAPIPNGEPPAATRAWHMAAARRGRAGGKSGQSSMRQASRRCRGGRSGATSITSNRGASSARSGRASRKADAARAMRRRWRGSTAAAAAARSPRVLTSMMASTGRGGRGCRFRPMGSANRLRRCASHAAVNASGTEIRRSGRDAGRGPGHLSESDGGAIARGRDRS